MTTHPAALPDGRGATIVDPPAELLRRPGLSKLALPDGSHGWLVTTHELVRAVLADNRFSSRHSLRSASSGDEHAEHRRGNLYALDPPEHTRYRSTLATAFTPRDVVALAPAIERIVNRCLADLAQAGPGTDLVATFARPIPFRTTGALLGVPDEAHAALEELVQGMLRADARPEDADGAVAAIRDMLKELVPANTGKDTLLGRLARPGDLDTDEVAMLGTAMILSGFNAAVGMLTLGVFVLLTHPDQLARLLADPSRTPEAIDEILRFVTVTSFGTVRRAMSDVDLAGERIRAGSLVVVSLPAANRDPARFPGPAEFDVTRRQNGHVSFGYGIHACPAQALVRLMMRTAYTALFRRFGTLRLAVPADQVRLHDDLLVLGVPCLPVEW